MIFSRDVHGSNHLYPQSPLCKPTLRVVSKQIFISWNHFFILKRNQNHSKYGISGRDTRQWEVCLPLKRFAFDQQPRCRFGDREFHFYFKDFSKSCVIAAVREVLDIVASKWKVTRSFRGQFVIIKPCIHLIKSLQMMVPCSDISISYPHRR